MHSIQQQATSALSSQKDRAADGMKTVIDAVRKTGESLRENNGTIAQYVDTAAGQLERWSQGLRDRDVSELMDEVGGFARRRPALFIGGGVAIGLLAARFLKSSAADSMSSSRGGYGYSGMSSGMPDRPSRTSSAPGQSAQQFTTSGSSGYRPGTSGSFGASGSPGAPGTSAADSTSSPSGLSDAGGTMGTTAESASGIAADRSSSRPRTRSRARTTDER